MSAFSLHAIISGNPLDLPGPGTDENGLTFLFPLSFGNTVNDLANVLNVPVDSILTANPGLTADSPLSVNQVIGLPDDQVNQILQSVNTIGSRSYVPTPAPAAASWSTPPSSSPSATPPSSGVLSASYVDQSLNIGAEVVRPTLHALASTLDGLDHPRQTVLLVAPMDDEVQGWMVSISAPVDTSAPVEVSTPGTTMSPSTSATNPPAAVSSPSPAPMTAVEPSTTLITQASSSPGNVAVSPSSPRQNQNEDAFSFMQSVNAAARTAADRQRNPDTDVPPPPMDPRWFAGQVTSGVPGSISITPSVAVTNAANLPNSPTALQLMALLMAQSGGSLVAGASSSAQQQAQPYIDPQALAALAAGMRITKVVDLGAGRSMAFSLVRDRLQRIDPIGEEDRAASRRRSGDGLDEVRVGRPEQDDVEQTDEQREQGRRRRAAIAAMRRRRRARSRRCRYWRGSRSVLRTSATTRYPKGMDWAEFRSRQPPRYRWNVGDKR